MFWKERLSSLVVFEAIVEEKMAAGGEGRKLSDGAALGRGRQREAFVAGAAAPHAHQFPKRPCHLERRQCPF